MNLCHRGWLWFLVMMENTWSQLKRNSFAVLLCQWHKREQKTCLIVNVEWYYAVLGPVELNLLNEASTEDCQCQDSDVVPGTGL